MAVESDLFALAERRLDWIDQRQRVVAQNIANANTPSYQARDLSPFDSLVHAAMVVPMRTNPAHLQGLVQNAMLTRVVPDERAPDGNGVNVEGELTKIADNETNAALVGNLWKSYMGMYLNALGRGG